MADDRDSSSPRGPLAELVPALRRRAERFPPLPVHPRVVHARAPSGSRSIVLSSFAPPASLKAFHAALKPLVEATLLAELSRPPGELARDVERLTQLELYLYRPATFDLGPALAPFGFRAASLDQEEAHRAQALLRSEARQIEGELADEAVARFVAPLGRAAQSSAPSLSELLLKRAPPGPWGSQPGALARLCADTARELGTPGIEPTRAGIEQLEALIVPALHDTLRWPEPILFQALCDLVAVAASVEYGRAVQWGVCEPDEESGLAPPPLLRVERDGDEFHVPLGEHVLRWCVMPTRAGETIPTLGAWAEHEFT